MAAVLNIFNVFSAIPRNVIIACLTFADIEKEFEDNERRLMELSSELVGLNCEMQVHLQVKKLGIPSLQQLFIDIFVGIQIQDTLLPDFYKPRIHRPLLTKILDF